MAKNREVVKNILGSPIAYIDHYEDDNTVVKDPNGNYLGYTNKNGTYDYTGRPISSSNCPGLLIKK